MLKIARQCGNRNGGPQILTFGEFCVYLREMQMSKQHRKAQQTTKQNNSKSFIFVLNNNNNMVLFAFSECSSNCEVFLGGSCNPTTWRTDTAIPELKKQGITFYNPVSVNGRKVAVCNGRVVFLFFFNRSLSVY